MKIVFNINYKCDVGCSVAVVGSCQELGEWTQGRQMLWSNGDFWRLEVSVSNVPFEYKSVLHARLTRRYQIVDQQGTVRVWEATSNRSYTTLPSEQYRFVVISDVWEQPSNTHTEYKVRRGAR